MSKTEVKRIVGCSLTCALAILLVSGLTATVVNAVTVTLNVTVTLVQPPCVVNDNNPIVVDFEAVDINSINGVYKRMSVPWTFSCPGGTAIKLQIAGPAASFNTQLLATSSAGLGIKVQNQNLATIPVNTWVTAQPTLWVVPLANGASLPQAGQFTAMASLKLDYQ